MFVKLFIYILTTWHSFRMLPLHVLFPSPELGEIFPTEIAFPSTLMAFMPEKTVAPKFSIVLTSQTASHASKSPWFGMSSQMKLQEQMVWKQQFTETTNIFFGSNFCIGQIFLQGIANWLLIFFFFRFVTPYIFIFRPDFGDT